MLTTMIYAIASIAVVIADIADYRSNKRVLKQIKESKKILKEDIRINSEYQSITEGMLDTLNKKTTAQDNYLWKAILILAQKIGEKIMLDKQLSLSDDFWVDSKLRRKLERVDIIQTQLYKHNALTPDDYTDMLKEADRLLNAAEDVVKYLEIKREEYIE